MTVTPATITIEEAARTLGVSKWSLYRLVQAGKFSPAVHFGSRVRVHREKLTDWLATGGQVDPTPKVTP